MVSRPIKLQGLGPGGIVGAGEFQDRQPDDPRFNLQGTTIDGRFFKDNEAAWDATVAALPALAGVNATHPVLKGADVTVVARSQTAFNIGSGDAAVFDAARIDGIAITMGRGEGAGGIQAQAFVNNLHITNDVLESDGGVLAGGIGLGQPYYDSHNYNARVRNTRVLGSGGLTRAGGIGIFRDSNNYEIADSVFCSNFSVVYGAGISHWGRSPGGSIHDNKIYYNDAVDSGGGITISHETPQPLPDGTHVLGTGSGPVDVDRNLIQSNYSGDDGGGIFVQNGLNERINIRTNMDRRQRRCRRRRRRSARRQLQRGLRQQHRGQQRVHGLGRGLRRQPALRGARLRGERPALPGDAPGHRAEVLQPGRAVQQHLLGQPGLYARRSRGRAPRSTPRASSTSRSTARAAT